MGLGLNDLQKPFQQGSSLTSAGSLYPTGKDMNGEGQTTKPYTWQNQSSTVIFTPASINTSAFSNLAKGELPSRSKRRRGERLEQSSS